MYVSTLRSFIKAMGGDLKIIASSLMGRFSKKIRSKTYYYHKSQLGMKLPSIRTRDIDFLVERPYKGKSVDVEDLLKPLGFQIGFQPDGATYFTNGTFRVEFLTPEKGKGDETSAPIKALGIRAEPLRFTQMLMDASIKIKKKDFSFNVPNPYTLAFHKILIGARRKNPDKKKKDMMQAGALRGGRDCLDSRRRFLSDKLFCLMPLPACLVV